MSRNWAGWFGASCSDFFQMKTFISEAPHWQFQKNLLARALRQVWPYICSMMLIVPYREILRLHVDEHKKLTNEYQKSNY